MIRRPISFQSSKAMRIAVHPRWPGCGEKPGRKFALAIFASLARFSAIGSAFAQAPPPVPALPDSERRTSYSIAASQCSCAVNFQLFGDSNDYWSWLEVYLNGVLVNYNDPTFGWTITVPTGTLSTRARPISDALLTFNTAQTG